MSFCGALIVSKLNFAEAKIGLFRHSFERAVKFANFRAY